MGDFLPDAQVNGFSGESLKRIILDESKETFKLPVIIPIESMEGITE